MYRPTPTSTHTHTLFPYPPPFRSPERLVQPGADRHARFACDRFEHRPASGSGTGLAMHELDAAIRPEDRPQPAHDRAHDRHVAGVDAGSMLARDAAVSVREPRRSEEHTSELQSLMRNSYAVFVLNKKTKNQ